MESTIYGFIIGIAAIAAIIAYVIVSAIYVNEIHDRNNRESMLTEGQLVNLENAIRREGYDILTFEESNEIVLRRNVQQVKRDRLT